MARSSFVFVKMIADKFDGFWLECLVASSQVELLDLFPLMWKKMAYLWMLTLGHGACSQIGLWDDKFAVIDLRALELDLKYVFEICFNLVEEDWQIYRWRFEGFRACSQIFLWDLHQLGRRRLKICGSGLNVLPSFEALIFEEIYVLLDIDLKDFEGLGNFDLHSSLDVFDVMKIWRNFEGPLRLWSLELLKFGDLWERSRSMCLIHLKLGRGHALFIKMWDGDFNLNLPYLSV